MEERSISIETPHTAEAFAALRELLIEYADGLELDLAFQGFHEELEDLHHHYGPPDGALFLARDAEGFCGCVAVRRFNPGNCEMKRLYVRHRVRGSGVGRLLAQRAIVFAKTGRYDSMVLDTLPMMASAIQLYRSLGFTQIAPYYSNPVEGTVYMSLRLGSGSVEPRK
jgi:putative acetyltransferase